MTKEARKKQKAVEKIREFIRKAVDKGVSATVVSATVEDAMAATTDDEVGGSEAVAPATAKAAKMPVGAKSTDVKFKRGATAPKNKPKLKKLPGKTKPPALTPKRGKNSQARSTL